MEMSDGWCKLFRDVARKVGPVGAGVFGEVWYYAHLPDGYCHAGVATMAKDLGVTKRTVIRHLKKLREGGWIMRIKDPTFTTPAGYVCTYVPIAERER